MFEFWQSYGAYMALVFLTFLSAMFSASETAFIAASRAHLHRKIKAGNTRAQRVMELRKRMPRLLSTLLLCNTLANILASAIATQIFLFQFGEMGVVYATAVMTTILVIYAEVLPKVVAVNYSENYATFVVPFIYFLVTMLAPCTRAIDFLARLPLKLMRLKSTQTGQTTLTVEELKSFIDLHGDTSEKTGKKKAHERLMLRSILDLADVDVEEVMIHRKKIFTLNVSEKPEKIVEAVLESPYTRIPLWKNTPDNIVGVLHTKSFLRDIARHQINVSSLDVLHLATAPWFIPETTTLLDQLQAFRQRREHFALVVDEYGALLGMVTLEDILEEIVGEISDELDQDLSGVYQKKSGEYIIDGTTTIRDLNRRFDWTLPDEEASTIAGLVLYHARHIPEAGQTFQMYGFHMTVLRRTRNQLTLIKVVKENAAPPAQSLEPHEAKTMEHTQAEGGKLNKMENPTDDLDPPEPKTSGL